MKINVKEKTKKAIKEEIKEKEWLMFMVRHPFTGDYQKVIAISNPLLKRFEKAGVRHDIAGEHLNRKWGNHHITCDYNGNLRTYGSLFGMFSTHRFAIIPKESSIYPEEVNFKKALSTLYVREGIEEWEVKIELV